MCSRHQSYLSCSFETLSVYNTVNRFRQRRLLGLLRFRRKKDKFYFVFKASLVLFYSFVIIVLQLHFCYFCGIFVNRKYTFYLKFVVYFNFYLHG